MEGRKTHQSIMFHGRGKGVSLTKARRNALAVGAPAKLRRSKVALLSRPGLMVEEVIIE